MSMALEKQKADEPWRGVLLQEGDAAQEREAQTRRFSVEVWRPGAFLRRLDTPGAGPPDFLAVAAGDSSQAERTLQRIRCHPRTALLPCYHLGPPNGSGTAQGWDGSFETLNESWIPSIQRIHQTLAKFVPVYDHLDSRLAQIHFVRFVVSRSVEEIRPSMTDSADFPWHHRLPVTFGIQNPETTLAEWHHQGWAKRKLIDKILGCPQCQGHRLNRREVCPHCGALEVHRTTHIHHKACGHADRRQAFEQGDLLLCPQCGQELLQPEVDYRIADAELHCAECQEKIAQVQVECFCYTCQRAFESADLKTVPIHIYYPTPTWEGVSMSGRLPRTVEIPAFHDRLPVYSYGFFEQLVYLEQKRCSRYGTQYSFLGLLFSSPATREGDTATTLDEAAGQLARILRGQLRETDVAARAQKDVLLVLLCHTSVNQARNVLNRLREELKVNGLQGWDIRSGIIAGRPKDDPKQRLEVLIRDLRQFRDPIATLA